MKIVVNETERVVVIRDGRVVTVLAAGRHRLPGRTARRQVHRVDVRRRQLVVAGQELVAADVPGVRVTLALTYRVVDPVRFLTASVEPLAELYVAAQLVLRDAVARRTVPELTADREALGAELIAGLGAPAEEVGVEVVAAQLRDVVAPGELRRALVAVETARLEGQAALERARGETAALRALANGARLLAEHPGLLRLRTAQVVGASGGTVVLHDGREPVLPSV